MNVADVVQAVRALNDEQLKEAVAYLAGDWTEDTASTMQAMVFIWNTGVANIRKDKPIREQAQ